LRRFTPSTGATRATSLHDSIRAKARKRKRMPGATTIMIDDDLDEIPLDILRVVQEVNRTWRRCRRKVCKRGRGCRGRDVPCAFERLPQEPPRNREKAARDDARAMAIFQRMLKEKLDDHERLRPRARGKVRTSAAGD
jgi:hypothetical protein